MNIIKRLIIPVFIIAFIVVWFVFASNSKIEHIEDTNGADNYSLQTITDENIEKRDIGAKGFTSETNNISKRTTYSSRKYTGVTEVYGGTSIFDSYTVYVNYFDVYEGNVKLVILKDDKIIHEFKPNEGAQDFTVENAKGSYMSIRLAGESAKFKLDIN